jgi:hypothetical protein
MKEYAMRHPVPAGTFKPNPTTGEKKSDATTRAAQQIINGEKSARDAKTERLRLARLAHEDSQPVAKPAVKRRAKA